MMVADIYTLSIDCGVITRSIDRGECAPRAVISVRIR